MKLRTFELFYVVFVFYWNVHAELSDDAIQRLIEDYSFNINASIALSRNDKELLSSWNEEFQISQVNITTKFRLQMIRHKEHNFRKANNVKWINCIDFLANDIARSENYYVENEIACLKTVNAEVQEKRHDVDQIEREVGKKLQVLIKNWRKSYKYITHFCSIHNPNDKKNAENCLVENIERDNYNGTLQRLMAMKLEVMGQLRVRLDDSCAHLEECLRVNLSTYLTALRNIMEVLNRCYGDKRE